MKIGPQNYDYIVESGVTRNFEPWHAKDEVILFDQVENVSYISCPYDWNANRYFNAGAKVRKKHGKKERDNEEMGNAMKPLEKQTLDSKQEMDILAILDEKKSMKVRKHSLY